MKRRTFSALLIFLSFVLLQASCSKKGSNEKTAAKENAAARAGSAEATAAKQDTSKLKYVSDEVSISVTFDPEGTKRTVKLAKDQDKVDAYVIINFPDIMQISAVEFKLVLPDGVEIDNDKYYKERTIALGTFYNGLSEAFPCVAGPKLILHKLTLKVTKKLKNAEISLLPTNDGHFIGVAECGGDHKMVTASAYKAVINPEE